MVHTLKCHPEYYQAIVDGSKTYEVRRDDRCFDEGDILRLQEFDPREEVYTGREQQAKVTHTLYGEQWGVLSGYIVMAIKPI